MRSKSYSNYKIITILSIVVIFSTAVFRGPILFKDSQGINPQEKQSCIDSNYSFIFSNPLSRIGVWHSRIKKLNEYSYQVDFFGPFGVLKNSYMIGLTREESYSSTKSLGRRFICEGSVYRK